ncbi:MAG TPA: hypothetical protein VJH03_26875 [Blastocatellia bacterium]|nr:hypothetical protein [Blastocatellia bacterium]
MIENDEQLDQTRIAIAHLETGLSALKREVLPLNPARFALMAEPALDHIRELRRQVEEYVGVTSAVSQGAELWMRLEGPEIELGDAPTSVVTAMLDILRLGVQSVAEYLQRGAMGVRPTASLKDACDLRIVGWMPGSVQVGLRLPEITTEAVDGMDLREQARKALRLYLDASNWVAGEDDASELERLIPEAEQRRLLLNQIARLVPRPRGAAELVELSGRSVASGPIRLRRSARARVRNALSHGAQEHLVTAQGLLREIDLDERSFIVRDPIEVGKETRCQIAEETDDLLEIAKAALDHAVVVRGAQRKDATRRQAYPLRVQEIEVLDQEIEEPQDS